MGIDLLQVLKRKFQEKSGLSGVETSVKTRSDGDILIFHIAYPTERLFRVLETVIDEVVQVTGYEIRATIQRSRKADPLQSAEGRLLLRTLSESLNISRNSYNEDFFMRYTKSVSGAEDQINSAANHAVFGRRGAGKSSLLLFGLHSRMSKELASVWVDMQVFSQRDDIGVAIDLYLNILNQLDEYLRGDLLWGAVTEKLRSFRDTDFTEEDIRKVFPDIRQVLGCFARKGEDLVIFLDDYHVIAKDLQPKLLSFLYAVTRGNGIYLKLSSIEALTKMWDTKSRDGLQIPHDVQTIKLDYNLTIPEKATEHITSILNSHAVYCGLPSIRFICTSQDVLSRLVWVSAGVPRDALNIFGQAMTKAALTGHKRVSVSSTNIAASETVTIKMDELNTDATGDASDLERLLNRIRDFCIKQQNKNAFLVEIVVGNDNFKKILELVDLRLLHVINEGISVRDAGTKFLALILDYGFYIGIRAARSVDLFNKQTKRVTYRDLRSLPIFTDL